MSQAGSPQGVVDNVTRLGSSLGTQGQTGANMLRKPLCAQGSAGFGNDRRRVASQEWNMNVQSLEYASNWHRRSLCLKAVLLVKLYGSMFLPKSAFHPKLSSAARPR